MSGGEKCQFFILFSSLLNILIFTIMNSKFCFLAIVLLCLSASCSSFDNNEGAIARDEVIIDDGYKTAADGAIIIDDADFEGKTNSIAVSRKGSEEITQIAKDGSQINVMYDSYGNKVETRKFNNNPLLKFVLLRTSVDGSKQVFVYGQRGEVKSLPENMLNKILTAPANELANSAGIFESFKQNSSFTQDIQPSVPLKPLPSSQLQIRNQQIEQTVPEEIEQPTDTSKKTVVDADDNKLSGKRESVTLNKKPDEQ